MIIFNKTRKSVLSDSVEVADTPFRRALGLMFRKSLPKGASLLMEFEKEGRHGIWMPFMRFPIDVVFADSGFRVVDVFESVPPIGPHPRTWKLYSPGRPARFVIELPSGSVAASGTRKGDALSLVNNGRKNK